MIERIAVCKTSNCPAKAKLIQHGKDKKSITNLFYHKTPHLDLCKVEENVFDDSRLKEFLKEGLKPGMFLRLFFY